MMTKNFSEIYIKNFIEYCQKNSIDEYIINEYYKCTSYPFSIGVIKFQAVNNYPYCMLKYDYNSYVFRFKNMKAINKFAEFYSSIKNKLMNNYKFDYENNETTIMINGHCLKYCIYNWISHINCIDTFDAGTGLRLITVTATANETFIHNNIQTIIGKLSEFKCSPDWVIFKNIPSELKDLVTAQKVMLSMIGE